ncbi:MAG: PAS domain-containing protein [Phycisphaerales bacterium]|jgi:PAS domain S-box-containing protein
MAESDRPSGPGRSTDDDLYRSFAANIPGIAYRATLSTEAGLLLVEGDSKPICGLPVEHFRIGGLQAMLDIVLEEDRQQLLDALERSARTGDSITLEYRIRHADGSIRWVSDSMRPIHDDSDTFLYHDGIVLDVTERRATEEKLDSQRQLLENIIANIPVFVFWKDRACRYLGCNQLVADIAGLDSPAGLVGRDDFDDVMPWTAEQARAFHRDDVEVMESGQTRINVEESQTQADGTTAHLLTSKVPLRGENGEVSGLLGLSFDITERRRTEERLDLAIRAANEGLWDWNLITDEVFFNDTTFSMLGYERGDVEHTLDSWRSLVHQDDLAHALTAIQQHLDGLTPSYRCEIRVRASDGSWRWILDVGEVTDRDSSGRPVRMIGVHIDVTELRAARERAEAADRAKSEFLSNMSHELRTPLNGVLGYAQLLLRDANMTGEQRRSMSAIQSCGQHLLTLINDVLDLARIESGKLRIEMEDTDLQKLLTSVRDVLAQRATEKDIALCLDVSPEVPRGVSTDATKLRQVLVNLAGNAIKFTSGGSVTLRVSEPAIGTLRFEVEDTGVGMTPQELDRVFEAFAQADAGKHAGGTGLGLAISRNIVAALGGEIEATSEPGIGSRFRFDIPLREVELDLSSPAPAGLDDQTSIAVPAGRVLRVLVADDRPENRDIVEQMLALPGIEVTSVDNGQAAVEQAEVLWPDVVLMDVRMPVMNGIDATRAIRGKNALSQIKIIAISASVFENQRRQIQDAGCDGFLGKPLQAAELYGTLAELCDLELTTDQPLAGTSSEPQPPLSADLSARHGARLASLASVGDVSAIEAFAGELAAASDPERALAERIAGHLAEFDLDALRLLAEQLSATEQP